jgi:acyl-CoA thioester hydrolase
MDFATFNHKTPIQIRFVDIDAFGHVNNAVFASYFEMARVSYFDDVLGKRINWKKNGMILAKNILEYFQPVFLHDSLTCYTSVTKLGNKSIEIQNALIRNNNNDPQLVSSGIGTLVCYDYESNQTIQILNDWRDLISQKENL